MQKGIQIIADTMNKPEWTGEDIPDNSPLKPLVNSIVALKASKMPPTTIEKDLKEYCYLLFFTTHILSTHFPISKDTIKSSYEQVITDIKDPAKTRAGFSNLSNVLDILIPILNMMEQIYQSKKDGSFKIMSTEFKNGVPSAKDLFKTFTNYLNQHTIKTQAINDNFAKKSGNSVGLSKIYIILDYKNNNYDIINTQGGNTREVNIQLEGTYSTITKKLKEALSHDLRLTTTPAEPELEGINLSYPVLFYFLIFTLKIYLSNRTQKGAEQCQLPKIFQA